MELKALCAAAFILTVAGCKPGNAAPARGRDPSRWSASQGRLTWEGAAEKCRELGLDLPAAQDYAAAEGTDAYASWEPGAYWSSTSAAEASRARTFLVTDVLGIPSGGLDRAGEDKSQLLLVRCIDSR